jgi:hypothetical protein
VEWHRPCKTPLAVLKGSACHGRMPCPATLRATTAFVLETWRGVGLPGDRQGAMLAIDVGAVATRLQDEGATLFVNAWNERMGGIASKSATLVQAR